MGRVLAFRVDRLCGLTMVRNSERWSLPAPSLRIEIRSCGGDSVTALSTGGRILVGVIRRCSLSGVARNTSVTIPIGGRSLGRSGSVKVVRGRIRQAVRLCGVRSPGRWHSRCGRVTHRHGRRASNWSCAGIHSRDTPSSRRPTKTTGAWTIEVLGRTRPTSRIRKLSARHTLGVSLGNSVRRHAWWWILLAVRRLHPVLLCSRAGEGISASDLLGSLLAPDHGQSDDHHASDEIERLLAHNAIPRFVKLLRSQPPVASAGPDGVTRWADLIMSQLPQHVAVE